MMRFLRGVCFGLLFAGAAHAAEPRDLTASERSLVEAIMKRKLRDPGAAQFQSMGAVDEGERVLVCGELNAKNVYGGYVGFVPFYGRIIIDAGSPYFHLTALADDQATELRIRQTCAKKGLRVPN